MRGVFVTLLFAAACLLADPALTAHRHHLGAHYHRGRPSASRYMVAAQRVYHYADGRPAEWCGWFMRQVFDVSDRAYNRAANWAHWGEPANGPQIGAVVVWPHHVGRIDGGPDERGHWLVYSGNDGHAVRSRLRSLAGAIAFRVGEAGRELWASATGTAQPPQMPANY